MLHSLQVEVDANSRSHASDSSCWRCRAHKSRPQLVDTKSTRASLFMHSCLDCNNTTTTLIVSLQTLLSKAISLEIFQSLRSLLTDSSHVSLGLPLPPLYIIDPLKNPITHRRLRGPSLDMSKPSKPMLGKFLLNWCHPDPIPNNFVPDSIPPWVPAKLPQHPHLCYTQLLEQN